MMQDFLNCQTIIEVLSKRAQDEPQKTAYTFLNDDSLETTLSYSELDQKARAVATYLESFQLNNKPILLAYPTGLEFIISFFGCLYAQSIAVPVYPPDPLNFNNTLPRIETIIEDSNAEIILAPTELIKQLSSYLKYFQSLLNLKKISLDLIDLNRDVKMDSLNIDSKKVAFLQYTSGSTSKPKGVILTHKNIIEFERMLQKGMSFSNDITYVGWLPLHHDAGLIGNTLQSLFSGTHCVFMSPFSFLQRPFRWLKAISDYNAQISGGPNFGYELCARKISNDEKEMLDLSHWRVAWSSAEPVRFETIEKFSKSFEQCGFKRKSFCPCYGLAEATLAVTCSGGEPKSICIDRKSLEKNTVNVSNENALNLAKILVSSGKVYSDQKVRIVNPFTKKECSANQIGEIWVQGPNVALGYWNNPKATDQVFKACINGDKDNFFLKTGDLGFIKEGELYVTGRLKDLIIVRGQNYYPHDIEQVVEKSHQLIRPGCTAAFSIDDDKEEKLIVLAEIYSKKSNLSNSDLALIKRKIQASIINTFQIKAKEIILLKENTMPKTSSGKHQHFSCKENFIKGTLERLESI